MTSQTVRQENLLSECINSLKTWKNLIDNYLEGEEKAQELNQLEEVVKDYCLIDFNERNSLEVCREVTDICNNESVDTTLNIDDLLKEKLANKATAFDDNYPQHRVWKEVFMEAGDEDVEEVLTKPETQEATEYEEMNDSIFYSNVFTPPIDPISKTVIQDPYKNKSCGHVYEYRFILQYIKSMKSKAKCPYMGCGNRNLTVAQLKQDTETKNKIEKYIKTNKSQTSSEDDD